jgi:hypothetical protein
MVNLRGIHDKRQGLPPSRSTWPAQPSIRPRKQPVVPIARSNDAPRVSVVMAARDVAGLHFRRALGSTLRSRGVAFEVVVVDHGSLEPVVVEPQKNDERVTVVRIGRAVSFVDALNAGIAVADADVIARMDADDIMHPDRLRLQLQALNDDDGVSVVSSRIGILPKTTTMMRGYAMWQNSLLTVDDHRRDRFIEQPVCNPATMLRRRALDDVGGYVDGDFPEDYDLFLRLLGRGHRVIKLPFVHHDWRQHPAQLTRAHGTDRDTLARLKARHLVADFGLVGRDVVVVGAGKEGRRISRALRGAGAGPMAFVDVDPKKVGRVTHDVPVHGAEWLAQRPPGAFVVGAVGTSGARGAIRVLAADAGLHEGADFVVVA